MTHRTNTPMAKTFLHILGLVYSPEPDYEEIAAVISTDVVLTIRLLRLINVMYGSTGTRSRPFIRRLFCSALKS